MVNIRIKNIGLRRGVSTKDPKTMRSFIDITKYEIVKWEDVDNCFVVATIDGNKEFFTGVELVAHNFLGLTHEEKDIVKNILEFVEDISQKFDWEYLI